MNTNTKLLGAIASLASVLLITGATPSLASSTSAHSTAISVQGHFSADGRGWDSLVVLHEGDGAAEIHDAKDSVRADLVADATGSLGRALTSDELQRLNRSIHVNRTSCTVVGRVNLQVNGEGYASASDQRVGNCTRSGVQRAKGAAQADLVETFTQHYQRPMRADELAAITYRVKR